MSNQQAIERVPPALRVRLRSLLTSDWVTTLMAGDVGPAADQICEMVGEKMIEHDHAIGVQLVGARYNLQRIEPTEVPPNVWQHVHDAGVCLNRILELVPEPPEASLPPAGSTAERARREHDPMGMRSAEVSTSK